MAAKALQAVHRRERRLQTFDRLRRADPTEIPGAGDGEQVEADVGRRGSVSDRRRGFFLKIIGRQHVVAFSHEGLEVAPGPTRGLPKDLPFSFGNRSQALAAWRQADDARGGGRDQPERDERRRDGPCSVAWEQRDQQRYDGEAERPGHSQREPSEIETLSRGGLRRRRPFEQVAAADENPPQRSRDGVAHHPGLVGQKREVQGRQDHGQSQILAERPEVTRNRDPGTPRRNRRNHGDEIR